MPRFYFDIRDQNGTEFDETGIELQDIDSARLEARRAIAGIISETIEQRGSAVVSIEIRTGEGRTVVEVVVASDERRRAQ